MGSKKRSAQAKQLAEFKAGFDSGGLEDVFAREDERRAAAAEEREAALRYKACERKNRYATRGEAEDAIRSCADYGTTGLHVYRCSYCGGWHLTSKND